MQVIDGALNVQQAMRVDSQVSDGGFFYKYSGSSFDKGYRDEGHRGYSLEAGSRLLVTGSNEEENSSWHILPVVGETIAGPIQTLPMRFSGWCPGSDGMFLLGCFSSENTTTASAAAPLVMRKWDSASGNYGPEIALAVELDDGEDPYGSLRTASSLLLSPSGDLVYVPTSLTGRSKLYRLEYDEQGYPGRAIAIDSVVKGLAPDINLELYPSFSSRAMVFRSTDEEKFYVVKGDEGVTLTEFSVPLLSDQLGTFTHIKGK